MLHKLSQPVFSSEDSYVALNSSSTNVSVTHTCKVTQKPDCRPVLPAGSSLCCVARERTEDKDRYEDDIAEQVKKHCQATLLTTAYIWVGRKKKGHNCYRIYIQGTAALLFHYIVNKGITMPWVDGDKIQTVIFPTDILVPYTHKTKYLRTVNMLQLQMLEVYISWFYHKMCPYKSFAR